MGDVHSGDLQGELPRLMEGLKTRTGLPETGDEAGDGVSFIQGDMLVVGVGSRGGEVSSRIAWLLTNTFDLALF